MCFDEQTGHFLWQLVVPKRTEDIYFDWPKSGIASPVTVEGERLYMVSNRGEVLCLDPRPRRAIVGQTRRMRTNQPPSAAEPHILWRFDLTAGAGIWSHDAAHSSILIRGDHLYLNTGTGVDNTHKRIRTPDAPSLVVLDKRTGRLVARENEHIAPNIFHSTWSAPSLAEVNGRPLLFFAAGNGIVYAFEPVRNALMENRHLWIMDDQQVRPRRHRSTTPSPAFLRRSGNSTSTPVRPRPMFTATTATAARAPATSLACPCSITTASTWPAAATSGGARTKPGSSALTPPARATSPPMAWSGPIRCKSMSSHARGLSWPGVYR